VRSVEEAWVELLARVYLSVDWRRVRGRNPLDVFEHRVRLASYEPTVGRVLEHAAPRAHGCQSGCKAARVVADDE